MLKKSVLLLLIPVLYIPQLAFSADRGVSKAKYIFVMFGDGMGDNLVRLTEYYLSKQYGKDTSLHFSKFPNVALTHTHSASSKITCSSAAGTALFCGQKALADHIGMNAKEEVIESVGTRLKREGYKLGVCTTNGIDHATPASIYAHVKRRRDFFNICMQLAKSDIDFAAGSGFVDMKKPGRKGDERMLGVPDSLRKYQWELTTSLDAAEKSKTKKLALLSSLTEPLEDMTLTIDRKPSDLNLKDFTRLAIDKLYDPKGKGFFVLLEGGSIDHAMHANDAAAAVHEVINFNESVGIAMDFYRKHQKETLILIISDHETGGLSLGRDGSRNFTATPLMEQKMSYHKMEELLAGKHDIDSVLNFIHREVFSLTAEDRSYIKKRCSDNIKEDQKALYSRNLMSVFATLEVMQNRCHIGFSTKRHTGARVPMYSIGAGSDLFRGVLDNTAIPGLIYQAMGKKWE